MDTFASQPAATPAPVAAPAPSQPDQSVNVDAYLDTIFNKSDASTAAPVVSAPVSPQPIAPTYATPVTPPVIAPAIPGQQVNGQPVAAPENPMPYGVRQRIAQEHAQRTAAESRAYQAEQAMAEMKGYIAALTQQAGAQAQQRSAPPPTPDMISDPNGYAAWVQDQAVQAAKQSFAADRQALDAELRETRQVVAKTTWQTDRMRAVETYGAELVQQVEQQLASNKRLGDHYSYDQNGRPASNPFTRAISDMRQRALAQAIPNGDINAHNQRVIQEYLSNPQALAQHASQYAAQQRQALPAAPQPLANAPTGGSHIDTISADPRDDLRNMFARQRAERAARAQGRFGAAG